MIPAHSARVTRDSRRLELRARWETLRVLGGRGGGFRPDHPGTPGLGGPGQQAAGAEGQVGDPEGFGGEGGRF